MIASLQRGSVLIVPLQRSDRPLYARLYGDADTMRFIGAPLDAEAAGRSFEAALQENAAPNPRRWTWSVTAKAAAPPSGLIALVDCSDGGDVRCAELGGLFVADVRGQRHIGLGLLAVIDHALTALGYTQLRAGHAVGHRVAARVAAKLGFVRAPDEDRPGLLRWRIGEDDHRARAASLQRRGETLR